MAEGYTTRVVVNIADPGAAGELMRARITRYKTLLQEPESPAATAILAHADQEIAKIRRMICINHSKQRLDPVLRARCVAIDQGNIKKWWQMQQMQHLRAAL